MDTPQSKIKNQKSTISLIAAMGANRVIGRGGKLPWHLPDDLRHFKRVTTRHTVIMGRKTWDSVGTPLPNRRNMVVTRNAGFDARGAEVFHTLDEALRAAAGDGEVFIVGGGDIYRAALPVAHGMYLTRVHAEFDGDAFFPEWDAGDWVLREKVDHPADDRHAYAMTFERYERAR
jgi:dihydrofolate reductase